MTYVKKRKTIFVRKVKFLFLKYYRDIIPGLAAGKAIKTVIFKYLLLKNDVATANKQKII